MTVQASNLIAGREAEVKSQLRQKWGSDFVTGNVQWEGNCNSGYRLQLDWAETGDFSTVTIDATNLVASKGARVQINRNGGALYHSFSSAYLSLASLTPQVQLWASGAQAVCTGDCTFDFSQSATPSLDSVPASAAVNAQISLSGTNFDASGNVVLLDGVSQAVDSEDASNIVVTLS